MESGEICGFDFDVYLEHAEVAGALVSGLVGVRIDDELPHIALCVFTFFRQVYPARPDTPLCCLRC